MWVAKLWIKQPRFLFIWLFPVGSQKVPTPPQKKPKPFKTTKPQEKKKSIFTSLNCVISLPEARRQLLLTKRFKNWIYPPTPPTHIHKHTVLPGNVTEGETKATDTSWHSSSFMLHNQAWKTPRTSATRGLCQILLPYPPRQTTPQLLASGVPIPPSMMLQTRGQMANSNVYFCASFQIALAQPDGILCLPGVN